MEQATETSEPSDRLDPGDLFMYRPFPPGNCDFWSLSIAIAIEWIDDQKAYITWLQISPEGHCVFSRPNTHVAQFLRVVHLSSDYHLQKGRVIEHDS